MKCVHLCFPFTFNVFLPIPKGFLCHLLLLLSSSVTSHTVCKFTGPFPWALTTLFCYFHREFRSVWIQISVSESVCLSTHHNSDTSHVNPQFLWYLRMSTGPQKFRAAGSARLWRAHQLWIWGEEKGAPAPKQQMQLPRLKIRKVLNIFLCFWGV